MYYPSATQCMLLSMIVSLMCVCVCAAISSLVFVCSVESHPASDSLTTTILDTSKIVTLPHSPHTKRGGLVQGSNVLASVRRLRGTTSGYTPLTTTLVQGYKEATRLLWSSGLFLVLSGVDAQSQHFNHPHRTGASHATAAVLDPLSDDVISSVATHPSHSLRGAASANSYAKHKPSQTTLPLEALIP